MAYGGGWLSVMPAPWTIIVLTLTTFTGSMGGLSYFLSEDDSFMLRKLDSPISFFCLDRLDIVKLRQGSARDGSQGERP